MGKLDGIILLVFGCIIALLSIDFIIGAHFGIPYGFSSMAAELIICGLCLIIFGKNRK
jgi:hypothetical protein|nr:MAG TPA: hypothetical protein [Caudoviricetes sp.]